VADTAVGVGALKVNGSGDNNTAVGLSALQSSTGAFANTALGALTLMSSTGGGNTALGAGALLNNTGGTNNTAVGEAAGDNQTTGSNNVYIGQGIEGVAGENDTCRIKSIFGQTAASGSAVFITSGNKLGTMTSSVRFRDEIKPVEKTSEAILGLRPVSFRYKKEIDPQRIPQFGLVAEDVEKVNPDLIVRDKQGKPYSVRYDQVNAMLLNEFIKAHRKLEEQQKQIDALTAEIQQVRAQVDIEKLEPQNVAGNQH
jgi:Chaperone of endosialidase